MPAKPIWYSRLPGAIQELEQLPREWVDRPTVESILGIGRRRAQQIMAPCVTDRVGASGLADRQSLIAHLKRLAGGEAAYYESQRRKSVAAQLGKLREERLTRTAVWVEAPVTVVSQTLEGLPAGVSIQSGRVSIDFSTPQEALEKLLALAMGIGNDPDAFERAAR